MKKTSYLTLTLPRLFIGLVVVLSLFTLLAVTEGPQLVRRPLLNKFNQTSTNCKLQIGTIHFHALKSEIVLKDLDFYFDDLNTTQVKAHTGEVLIHLDLASLFSSVKKIRQVSVNDLTVLVQQGIKSPSAEPNLNKTKTEPDSYSPQIEVSELLLKDASFEYVKWKNNKRAPFHISKINGKIQDFGNSERLMNQEMQAHVTALIEGSGQLDFKLDTNFFRKTPYASISFTLKNQKLEKANPFFTQLIGIDLKGLILESTVHEKLAKHRVHGNMTVWYKDLNLNFEPTKERSGLEASLANLLKGLKIRETNIEEKEKVDHHRNRISAVREEGESHVGFLLRGLKDAALKIAGG